MLEKTSTFWRFATPVLLGNMASLGAAALTRSFVSQAPENEEVRKLSGTFVGIGTFWLVAGFTWIYMNRKNVSA